MKLFKGGVVAAALSVAALGFGASSALAGPIGRAYRATGTIELQGGLGGSFCSSTIANDTNDLSVRTITFTSCTGAAGTPTPNALPWTISWSGNNGTLTADARVTIFGVACNYRGSVNVAYDSGAIALDGVMNRYTGSFPCPTSADLIGDYSL